jgi:hypothetical protein
LEKFNLIKASVADNWHLLKLDCYLSTETREIRTTYFNDFISKGCLPGFQKALLSLKQKLSRGRESCIYILRIMETIFNYKDSKVNALRKGRSGD